MSSSLVASNGSELSVESLDRDAARLHAEAWADLATRSLDANAFMDPAFGLSAAHHLPVSASLRFLMVWDAERRLIGVCPVVQAKLPGWPLASLWFHDLAALGGPLLDRQAAAPALRALLCFLEGNAAGCTALVMPSLAVEGPTGRLLVEVTAQTCRRIVFLDQHRRAVLHASSVAQPVGLSALSARRTKELRRQHRRLADLGALRYDSAGSPSDISDALDRFLVLEARGWKGAVGTALASDRSREAFVREMVGQMAACGQCRIDTLMLDDRPIAMGIVLASGETQFFWKTAFAEDHAALSPGVQFVLELTRRQHALGMACTDSCAIPDHPMIDRLWPDRLVIADAIIAIRPGQGVGFVFALALEKGRRRGRQGLKALYHRLRALRRRAP